MTLSCSWPQKVTPGHALMSVHLLLCKGSCLRFTCLYLEHALHVLFALFESQACLLAAHLCGQGGSTSLLAYRKHLT